MGAERAVVGAGIILRPPQHSAGSDAPRLLERALCRHLVTQSRGEALVYTCSGSHRGPEATKQILRSRSHSTMQSLRAHSEAWLPLALSWFASVLCFLKDLSAQRSSHQRWTLGRRIWGTLSAPAARPLTAPESA
jgi:hypothetical protein